MLNFKGNKGKIVSNSQKTLHRKVWGHDQQVIFNCHDDDFPKATLNVVDQ